jgi:hypothetical protein
MITGVVYVHLNGEWGAVCGGTSFTQADANVACRQLGYDAGVPLNLPLAPWPAAQTVLDDVEAPPLLQNLGCTGSEERLVDCAVEAPSEEYNYYASVYNPVYYVPFRDVCATHLFAAVGCGNQSDGAMSVSLTALLQS